MKQSDSLDKLAAALVAAQKEMPSIEKDAAGHGYKYASLDQIMSKVRPVLAENGLVIVQHPTSQDADAMGLTTRLLHASGQYLEETVYAPRDDGQRRNSVQAAGSTITYLKRYGIAALLGLADESDTDGTPPPTRNKTKQQPSQDTRGATSPQKQAERKRPAAPKANGDAASWREKALKAKSLPEFASAAAFGLDGYKNDHHVTAALEGVEDFEYNAAKNEVYWDWLSERKTEEA